MTKLQQSIKVPATYAQADTCQHADTKGIIPTPIWHYYCGNLYLICLTYSWFQRKMKPKAVDLSYNIYSKQG